MDDEESFRDPVPLAKGINLSEMIGQVSEFHIDLDFKKKTLQTSINCDDDLFPEVDDDDDSDDGDILKIIEDSAEKSLLASPEYQKFEELGAKMVDCLCSGACKMLIIEEGKGPLIPVDAEVTMHYAAYWEGATIPFDSTLTMNKGAPIRIRLGVGKCLPGIEIALTMMKGPSCLAHLLLQPSVTWGERGVPPRIRPETALFVIKVYQVTDVQAKLRFNDLPTEEQSKYETTTRTVKSIHSEAKHLFSKKKYMKAIKNYQQAITVINASKPKTEQEITEVINLKISAILNLTVCYSKMNQPKHVFRALENLEHLIDIEKHCKGLYYYGKAYEMKGNFEKALEYYQKALKLEPQNKEIGIALDKLDGYLKEGVNNEKKMWKKVFKTEIEEKIEVDEQFQNDIREMFANLAGTNEYAKFELPPGLSNNETQFVKSLTKEFEHFVVLEDGEGRKKRVTIVKKMV